MTECKIGCFNADFRMFLIDLRIFTAVLSFAAFVLAVNKSRPKRTAEAHAENQPQGNISENRTHKQAGNDSETAPGNKACALIFSPNNSLRFCLIFIKSPPLITL